MILTQNAFKDIKKDYDVFGVVTKLDQYNNEYVEMAQEPKCTINTMFHPLTDEASVAEYGQQIKRMYYAIVYGDPDIDYKDVVMLHGEPHEVVGIKYFNTYTRIDVKYKEGGVNG